jgi:hypothetical protein
LRITFNLYSAFFTLAQDERPGCQVLWVDAICIDQRDHEERGQRVRLMREIHMRAFETVVLLGYEAHRRFQRAIELGD